MRLFSKYKIESSNMKCWEKLNDTTIYENKITSRWGQAAMSES